MATQQEVHAKIKAAAQEARNARSRVESVPDDPPFQGIGNDTNYAYYWAERTLAHVMALDTKLGELGYPQ